MNDNNNNNNNNNNSNNSNNDMMQTQSSSTMATTATVVADSPPPSSTSADYQLRPYNPNNPHDRTTLQEICAQVYNGQDYLPQMAASYVADPACSFLALTTTTTTTKQQQQQQEKQQEEKILAVANYKRLHSQNSAWIEAVRTHPHHRNQGLASKLLVELINMAKVEDEARQRQQHQQQQNEQQQQHQQNQPQQPTNILTCTIQSNIGMKRALEKVGFIQCNTISILCFKKMNELPGWSNNQNNKGSDNGHDDSTTTTTTATTTIVPQPLLTALNLNHLVSPMAQIVPSSSWSTIPTEEALLSLLSHFQLNSGTCGYLPGLHEYIVPHPNRLDLKQSLEQGLVLSLDILSTQDKEISSCDNDAGVDNADDDDADSSSNANQAILAFTIDKRISSLKSQWVCSIVATSHLAFETALWHACHSSDVARKMHRSQGCVVERSVNGDDNDDTTKLTSLPFCLSFDGALPLTPGTLAHALPLATDKCVVFSYQHEKSTD